VREGFIKKSPPTPLYERGELKKLGRNYRLCLLCSFPSFYLTWGGFYSFKIFRKFLLFQKSPPTPLYERVELKEVLLYSFPNSFPFFFILPPPFVKEGWRGFCLPPVSPLLIKRGED